MISKELLSKVLDNEVPYQVKVHKIIIKNNSLNYFYNSKDNRGGLFEANEYINIYELAHKCKEWAYKQGYTIDVYNKTDGLFIEVSKSILGTYLYKSLLFDLEDEKNELFNACQWILDEDSK